MNPQLSIDPDERLVTIKEILNSGTSAAIQMQMMRLVLGRGEPRSRSSSVLDIAVFRAQKPLSNQGGKQPMTEERKQVTEFLRHLCSDIAVTISTFDINSMIVRAAATSLRNKFPQARFTVDEAIHELRASFNKMRERRRNKGKKPQVMTLVDDDHDEEDEDEPLPQEVDLIETTSRPLPQKEIYQLKLAKVMSIITEHESRAKKLASVADYAGAMQEKKTADHLRKSLPVTSSRGSNHDAIQTDVALAPPAPTDTLGTSLEQLSLSSTPPRHTSAPGLVDNPPGCRRSSSLSSSPVLCSCPACGDVDPHEKAQLVSQSEVAALLGDGGGGGGGGSGEEPTRTSSGVRPFTLLPPPPMLPVRRADSAQSSTRKRGTTAALQPDEGYEGDGSSDQPVSVPRPQLARRGGTRSGGRAPRGGGPPHGRGSALPSGGFTTAHASEIEDDAPVKASAAKRVRRSARATAAPRARTTQVQDEVHDDQE